MNSIKLITKFFGSIKSWYISQQLVLKIAIPLLAISTGIYFVPKVFTSATSSPQYQTAVVERGTLIVSLSSSGQVSSANSSSVTTSSTGVVSKVMVKNGQAVKAGDPLIQLDLDQSSKQKYIQATSSYQSAKNNLDSAKTNLYTLQSKEFAANQKFINDAVARNLAAEDPTYIQQNADWLAAESSYLSGQKAVDQAQTNLSSAWYLLQQSSPIIYAPISGVVDGISVEAGSVIGSSTTTSNKIASIKTSANPTISINLTEIDVPKVKIGNKATITIDALGQKTFTGRVISIDTVGSVSSGVTTYPAIIKLDVQNEEIYSNMSATATIITNIKDDVLLVPAAAIQTQSGQSTVRVMKDNQPATISVEIGISSSTQVEIISGLSEGDMVITGTTQSVSKTTTQTKSVFSSFGGSGSGARMMSAPH